MKVLVAYDGTLQSKDALRYGLEKAREKGGDLRSQGWHGQETVPQRRHLPSLRRFRPTGNCASRCLRTSPPDGQQWWLRSLPPPPRPPQPSAICANPSSSECGAIAPTLKTAWSSRSNFGLRAGWRRVRLYDSVLDVRIQPIVNMNGRARRSAPAGPWAEKFKILRTNPACY